MKRILSCLTILVLLSLAGAGAAAESSWSDLNRQVIEMYQKKYYSKAIPVAQKALDAAESAYGPDSPETVLALNPKHPYVIQANERYEAMKRGR